MSPVVCKSTNKAALAPCVLQTRGLGLNENETLIDADQNGAGLHTWR